VPEAAAAAGVPELKPQSDAGGDLSGLWPHFLGAIAAEENRTIPGQIPHFTIMMASSAWRRCMPIAPLSRGDVTGRLAARTP
jgi:hypothetical protein